MKPTILSCAVTGSFPTREHNANLPVTPEEIAGESIAAAKAGASICHIHVRDPETGAPSMELDYYREVVKRIRESDTDLIINLTTGPGGRFMPDDDDPTRAAPGTTLTTPEIRTEHVVELKPEICSLDLNTMWFGGGAMINSPRNIKIMAERIYAAGVMPELEVFDSGDIHLAKDLLAEGADQLFREVRTDALDHAGAEVLLDALQGAGRDDPQMLGLELKAVLAVVGPGPRALDVFPGCDGGR